MHKRKMLRFVIPSCIILAIFAGMFLMGSANEPIGKTETENTEETLRTLPSLISAIASLFLPEKSIISDGLSYPLNTIINIKLPPADVEENLLPVVGDRETLLKLLLDRGILYDGTSQHGRYDYRIHEEDFMSFGSDVIEAEFSASAPLSEPAPTASLDIADGSNGMSGDYSQTNEQVMGINEGDVVKTDGSYLYAMNQYGGTLRIISAKGSDLDIVSKIENPDIWGCEFYLVGDDRLVIIGSESVPLVMLPVPYPVDAAEEDNVAEPSIIGRPDYSGWYSSYNFTIVLIYDISDRSDPKEVRRVSMDGSSISTRVMDDTVYLVTNKHMWSIPYAEANSPSILPYCRDTNESETYAPISFDSIYYIPETNDSNYILLGAVSVYGDEPFKPYAYLGASSNLYMNRNAMYISMWRFVERSDHDLGWQSWHYMTDIMKFSINGTDIVYTGTGTAIGSPLSQYSMDEYNGYFRIATTDWPTGTYVTVFDGESMETVGRTEALAPGEHMRSMRFMGDMGYVVTFENMDPLFTIDLSDPYNPKMLGELKIPGFSQYLHPVGDGLLLGIGRDTQEIYTRDVSGVETVIGFSDVGMKASLFDVSDPYDPREVSVLSLGEGWTEVAGNPRALMVDRSRNVYGFMIQHWSNSSSRYAIEALLLSVDGESLSIAASISGFISNGEYININSSRLCYIGNTLYLIHENGIEAYDYTSYNKIGSLAY